jgi:alkylhydroperoxidase family enzyme
VWSAVVADWRTAPLRPELRAALAFIEVLTLRPDELTAADAEAAYTAGVSQQALRDAATVCALFNMITRLADSLGWDVPSRERLAARAPAMLEGGYSFAAMRQR